MYYWSVSHGYVIFCTYITHAVRRAVALIIYPPFGIFRKTEIHPGRFAIAVDLYPINAVPHRFSTMWAMGWQAAENVTYAV